jgi:hypothetical protein
VKQLKAAGIFHQRIESGETGRGIPDLYIRLAHTELWAELKVMPKASIGDPQWAVPWRAGQQAWAHNYLRNGGKYMVTIVAVRDGFLYIPMTQVFPKSIVPSNRAVGLLQYADLLTWISLEDSRYNLLPATFVDAGNRYNAAVASAGEVVGVYGNCVGGGCVEQCKDCKPRGKA